MFTQSLRFYLFLGLCLLALSACSQRSAAPKTSRLQSSKASDVQAVQEILNEVNRLEQTQLLPEIESERSGHSGIGQ